MPSCFDAFLRSQGFVLLDGGLASELESAGHDLNDPLWSAKVLLEDPGAVEAAHAAYLNAGADCVITATYQATFEGLAARGVGRAAAERIMTGAVDLAVRARDRFLERAERAEHGAARVRPLVAASIGPYGAFLADGSEYHGNYGVGAAALADFHRARLRLLAASPADMLACETIPSFAEARVLAGLVADATDKPAWFTFTCRDGRGGGDGRGRGDGRGGGRPAHEARLSDGTPIDEVAAWANETACVHAVGVNCTPARLIAPVVRALAAAQSRPVVAYPNGGGEWDAATKTWGRADAEPDWGEECRSWVAAGAAVVGGCCRVGPDAIRAMRAALSRAALSRAALSRAALAAQPREAQASGSGGRT